MTPPLSLLIMQLLDDNPGHTAVHFVRERRLNPRRFAALRYFQPVAGSPPQNCTDNQGLSIKGGTAYAFP